jgi:SAM-dependent methyltransferase
MSFWPLPKSLVEALAASRRRGPVVELGSGEGRFTRRLASLGLDAIGLDLRRPPGPTGPFVNADLDLLPFANGSVGAFVLADVLRHRPSATWPALARSLHEATAPGGVTVILEDHPRADDRAQENYRRTLGLLARVDASRGDVLSPRCMDDFGGPPWPPPVLAGEALNTEAVDDPATPLRWLRARAGQGVVARELQALDTAVRRWGMAYGRYWFCVLSKENRAA